MRHRSRRILAASVAAIVLACGYWWLSPAGKPAEGDSPDAVAKGADDSRVPVVLVKTDRIRIGEITETITAYGTIVPAPGAVQTVSVPFESRVSRVMISMGQRISRAEVLLEIEPSPDTYLQIEQARSSRDLAEENLRHTEQRFALKLATNDQLLQARQTFQQEKLRLESLEKRGIDGPRELKANVAGLIDRVHVTEGSIIAPGSPLVEIVAQSRLEARMGIEPDEINRVHTAQSVILTHVNMPDSEPTSGRIRKISHSVDPEERLVEVFVALPESTGFLLGEYVQGRLNVASSRGLVVPGSAVLPEGKNHILFTIEDGRAVKRVIRVGLEDKKEVEVFGEELGEGDVVVISGNNELKEGMAVREEGAP